MKQALKAIFDPFMLGYVSGAAVMSTAVHTSNDLRGVVVFGLIAFPIHLGLRWVSREVHGR